MHHICRGIVVRLCIVWGEQAIKPEEQTAEATRQALHWMIVLQENPDDADQRNAFEAWLVEREANAVAWRQATHLGALLDQVPVERRSAAAPPLSLRSVAPDRRPPAKAAPRRRPVAAALVAMAAAVALFVAFPTIELWLTADHSTGIAEIREIRLDDGTVVALGANSAIALDFVAAARNVRLLKGEAYFEVAPDSARPFRVRARDVEATVLGTGFDMGLVPDGVTVSVSHGRVGVSDPAAAPIEPLEAGQWVRLAEDGVTQGSGSADAVASWRHGRLVVEDRPIGEVVEQLRRHFAGSIIVMDESLNRARITGVYDLTDPAEALSAIGRVQGARVQQMTPWVLLVTRG